MKTKRKTIKNWSIVFKDIVDREAFKEVSRMLNAKLYNAVIFYRNKNEYANIIYNKVVKQKIRTKELISIINSKDWDRARAATNRTLYTYIYRNRNTNIYAKEIWKHIDSGNPTGPQRKRGEYDKIYRNIIINEDWDKARVVNNKTLYDRIYKSRKINPLAKIIWDHINNKKSKDIYDIENETLLKDIIDKKEWDLAKQNKNRKLYTYIYYHKDTSKYAKIVWGNININKKTKHWWREKLSTCLEDLCLLDKTQLLQIAFLKKLPKDIYEEILECPKGERRRKLLENLPDRLEAIKEEGEGQKTFEDSLDEAIDATENIQESEEKKFRNDLKTGIDLVEKPNKFNPEKKD